MGKGLAFLLVSAALGVGFAVGAQTSHDAPFDGYWWRAAKPTDKLMYVFGWEMGATQGELWGCQNALLPDKDAVNVCATTGLMKRITTGVSMGDMVGTADHYYNDPKHAADPPDTALANGLWDLYKRKPGSQSK